MEDMCEKAGYIGGKIAIPIIIILLIVYAIRDAKIKRNSAVADAAGNKSAGKPAGKPAEKPAGLLILQIFLWIALIMDVLTLLVSSLLLVYRQGSIPDVVLYSLAPMAMIILYLHEIYIRKYQTVKICAAGITALCVIQSIDGFVLDQMHVYILYTFFWLLWAVYIYKNRNTAAYLQDSEYKNEQ